MEEEKVTITKQRFDELRKAEAVLNALEAGGVDNWEWYSKSLEEHLPAEFKDLED